MQHVGEKRGTIETVAGVETYVSRPKDGSNKKIILFFADVYGPIYINSQLSMAYWAENGEQIFDLTTGTNFVGSRLPDAHGRVRARGRRGRLPRRRARLF